MLQCPLEVNSSRGPTPYYEFYEIAEVMDVADGILKGYGCSHCSMIKKIVHWVTKHIRYVTDISNFGLIDYWEFPTETLERGSGDCDDMSFLTASLLEAVGVPTRVVMGNTPFGYHMWVEAADEDGQWILIETTSGKIYPWAHRSKLHYYPDVYINPVGCSGPGEDERYQTSAF